MRTDKEQAERRADELAQIETELRALFERAKRADAPTGAYLIIMAADQIRADRQPDFPG